MATLKDTAKAYEPPQTKNIADLEMVSVDVEIKEETFSKQETGEEFTVKVIEVDGEKYRVPNSVLKQMKAILEKLPETKFVSVSKTGTGIKNTTYQVIPMQQIVE